MRQVSANLNGARVLYKRDFVGQLNLMLCFTPVASPESNGMVEAFVRAFKRDHLHLSPLPDVVTVRQ